MYRQGQWVRGFTSTPTPYVPPSAPTPYVPPSAPTPYVPHSVSNPWVPQHPDAANNRFYPRQDDRREPPMNARQRRFAKRRGMGKKRGGHQHGHMNKEEQHQQQKQQHQQYQHQQQQHGMGKKRGGHHGHVNKEDDKHHGMGKKKKTYNYMYEDDEDDEDYEEDEEYEEEEEEEEDMSEDEDMLYEEESSSTFDTNFTPCPFPAFNKFFQTYHVNSEHQTRILASHDAAQEYIKEQSITEASTPFYCALVMSLEGMQENEDVAADVSLMGRIIKRVPLNILKLKFDSFAKTLDMCLTKHSESSDESLLPNLIGGLSVLLRAQDKDQWTDPYTMGLFQKIVAFTTHEIPKIRDSAQYNTGQILKGSSFIVSEEYTHHPASVNAAEFCINQLSSNETDNKKIYCILSLLQQTIVTFPPEKMEVVCKSIVSVMEVGSSQLKTYCLQTFYALLVSEPPSSLWTAENNLALINALTSGKVEAQSEQSEEVTGVIPGINSHWPCIAWITVNTMAHVNLFKLDMDMGMNQWPLWCQRLTPYWESHIGDIKLKAGKSIEAVLEDCIESMDEATVKTYRSQLLAIFKSVESTVSIKVKKSRAYILTTLAKVFKVLGPHIGEEMLECFKTLIGSMGNKEPKSKYEEAIGAAIQGLGPKLVISVVPLQITGDMEEDAKHFWILPLMRKYVKRTQLAFYADFFVDLAGKCCDVINSLKEKNQGEEKLLIEAYETIEREIWSLLPNFCEEATDVQEVLANEKFTKILCDNIKFRGDTRRFTIAALRILLEENLENPGQLASCGDDYLHALFDIYLSAHPKAKGDGSFVGRTRRFEAYATIKIYLKILPQDKHNEFINLTMTKYDEEENFDVRQAIIDIARAFLPYMDSISLKRLYYKLSTLLEQTKEQQEQRSMYRLFEELLALDNAEAANFIDDNIDSLANVFLKSLSSVALDVKAPRLRCVQYILRHFKTEMEENKKNQFFNQVVVESIMCFNVNTSKEIRKTAFQLLDDLKAKLQEISNNTFEDTLRQGLEFILADLGSPTHAANICFGVIALMDHFTNLMRGELLELFMKNMSQQLNSQSKEVVGPCLTFLRHAAAVIPGPIMADHVDTIVQGICSMTDDFKINFKKKTIDTFARLMCKFGEDNIIGRVPEEDKILAGRLYAAGRVVEESKGKKRKKGVHNHEHLKKSDPARDGEIPADIDSDVEDEDDVSDKKLKKGNGEISEEANITSGGGEDDDIFDVVDASPSESALKTEKLKENDVSGSIVDSTGISIITEEVGKEEANRKLEHMEDIDKIFILKTEGKMKKRKRNSVYAFVEVSLESVTTQNSKKKNPKPSGLLSPETISQLTLKGENLPARTKFLQRRNALFAGHYDKFCQIGGGGTVNKFFRSPSGKKNKKKGWKKGRGNQNFHAY